MVGGERMLHGVTPRATVRRLAGFWLRFSLR
jgi:hypothetical protein